MILDNVNKENLISDLNNVFFSHNISADIKISKDDIIFSINSEHEKRKKSKQK